MAELNGGREQGRPRLGWMDGWREGGLWHREMTVEAAWQCPKDRKE